MPQGQFYPGAVYVTSPEVIERSVLLNRGIGNAGGAPTVTAGLAAGTAPTVTQQTGTDFAGSFVVTASAGGSGGTLASVVFSQPLFASPSSIVVDVADETAGGGTGVASGGGSFTTSQFVVYTASLTNAHAYRVSYVVIL